MIFYIFFAKLNSLSVENLALILIVSIFTMITDTQKEQILEQSDIVDVIGEVIGLKRRGSNFIGLCPFHNEKTPSFTVSPDKGIYKCFGCGESGNIITFMMKYHNLSYPEALKELALRCGIKIEEDLSPAEKAREDKKDLIYEALETAAKFYFKNLYVRTSANALAYFKSRQFSDETIKKFSLGYSPDSFDETMKHLIKQGFSIETLLDAGLILENKEKTSYYDRFRGRVMFPIFSITGKVIAFGARQLIDDKNQPKYLNSPQTAVYDKSLSLYGIYHAKNEIRSKDAVILVEGYADVITLHQAGITNAIASSGTSLTASQLRQLSRISKKLYISYDSDNAGQNASEKAIEEALELGFDISILKLPEGDDPDSLVREHGANVYNAYLTDAVNFIEFKYNKANSEKRLSSPKQKSDFTKSIIYLINRIPDTFQHDYFINILKSIMNLNERQLAKIYEEKQRQLTGKSSGKPNSSKPQVNNINSDAQSNVPKEASKTSELKLKPLDITPEEKHIIKMSLNNSNAYRELSLKFRINENIFISDFAKSCYSFIKNAWESNQNPLNLLFSQDDDSPDPALKQFLIDLSIEKDQVSHEWTKYGSEEFQIDVYRNIKDAILRLEIRKIDDELDLLKYEIKNADSEKLLTLLTKQNDLTSRRQQLINLFMGIDND